MCVRVGYLGGLDSTAPARLDILSGMASGREGTDKKSDVDYMLLARRYVMGETESEGKDRLGGRGDGIYFERVCVYRR